MSKKIDLMAKVLEYEHALEHIGEVHEDQCEGCRNLAQSALDGVNRKDFRSMAKDATLKMKLYWWTRDRLCNHSLHLHRGKCGWGIK